jgi:hypothetical protein
LMHTNLQHPTSKLNTNILRGSWTQFSYWTLPNATQSPTHHTHGLIKFMIK